MEEAPSPSEIRALRGARSRAEFAALIGVTPLTVYRWELPPDSPELRRPRGKVLQRLKAWIASQGGVRAPPPPPVVEAPADGARAGDATEHALLLPVLGTLDAGQLGRAETELVGMLTSGALRGEVPRARASIALAKLQLLARHDARAAFTSLLAAGADVARLPRPVQLQYHLVAALLHGHPDARLFNAGKSHHHAALAEALLGEADADERFLLGYTRLAAAIAVHEVALIARAMEEFTRVRALAATPLSQCLALEAEAMESLSLTNVSDCARKVEAFLADSAAKALPLQHVRALIWRAEVSMEEAAPPAQILALLEQAEQLGQRHRIAPGIHAMLMNRNKAEVLLRLGRLDEAEAALREAERIGSELSYTPHRIFTTLARLHGYRGRREETRALGERALGFEGVQRELVRAFGQVLLLLSEVEKGTAPPGAFETLAERLGALRRQGVWPVAWRYVALHALSVYATAGAPAHAERMLLLAERALEGAPSPTASALLRRYKGLLLLRLGRLTEARQALEAARATFEVSGNVPETALVRRLLANLDLVEGAPDAERRMARAQAELASVGVAVPPVFHPAVPGAQPAPASARPPEAPGPLRLEHLVVPLQRLTTRGLGARILQAELVNIAAELLPGRAVRLEEVDSAGAATLLGERGGPEEAPFSWLGFSDGVGRRLRLGVGGGLDGAARAALEILVASAALAFEVAGLRGFSAPAPRSAAAEPAGAEPEEGRVPGFIAASPSMRRLASELTRLSSSRATIIVTGESGTGKEVVARAIHELSQRSGRPYVTFNSAAVPRELFEGQLFGYRKGAFTGATTDHPGVIRAADGGTLFLDEIGELPLDVQPKLLRFLENGEVLPLGERRPVQVDVRIVAATHRDLLQLVREGKFREDLYYRLQVIPVSIAPLRERREDVVALARHFIRKLTPEGRTPPVLSPDGEAKLVAHAWPGNVRELRNAIERSLAFEPLPALLTAEHLRL